ncbi:hypothetical protein [[Mycobacterium] burgundiense]|uniref:Low molecular weight antigen MTB12-like C-terminal domain-containing protein n=1 Tax=[Mycobacterium] burgundiense TaxID=3064286 RepID=A0ABM9LP17_9MYCO|nr:hypothetical protein [Mycolicibacterium sp. MU0053]CAJ1502311.1 hypothetical protein MU0053_002148 [Mycolicibacterium sp. MU0053]
MKFLATGVAAIAGAAVIAGAAAAGVTSISASAPAPQAQLAVFGAPLPQNPAAAVPTDSDLYGVLNGLANPGVPFGSKGYLVEGGIGIIEGKTADRLMKNAVAKGLLPLNFTIADIAPAGPGAATANVTASGPGMASTTQNITFVNQGGWKLSRGSASQVLSMFAG